MNLFLTALLVIWMHATGPVMDKMDRIICQLLRTARYERPSGTCGNPAAGLVRMVTDFAETLLKLTLTNEVRITVPTATITMEALAPTVDAGRLPTT